MNEHINCLKVLTETEGIMECLRINLQRLDPEYATEENDFHSAVQSLKTALKPDCVSLVDKLISAEEDRISACVIYLFWQGLQQNEACFRNPAAKQFLELDFEDICQETVLNSLPEAFRIYECYSILNQALPGDQRERLSPIASYYSYLETVGYKLAHYWGFCCGDSFLPRVVPGYIHDLALTSAYRRMVTDYLGLRTSKIVGFTPFNQVV